MCLCVCVCVCVCVRVWSCVYQSRKVQVGACAEEPVLSISRLSSPPPTNAKLHLQKPLQMSLSLSLSTIHKFTMVFENLVFIFKCSPSQAWCWSEIAFCVITLSLSLHRVRFCKCQMFESQSLVDIWQMSALIPLVITSQLILVGNRYLKAEKPILHSYKSVF